MSNKINFHPNINYPKAAVLKLTMSENLPTDIILEIISRLPSKSIARCHCLSKLWASLLTSSSPYFTELFLTQSKTRPRILFAVHGNFKLDLYSCPQPQFSYKNADSSLSLTVEFHMSLPKNQNLNITIPIPGLVYCYKTPNFNTPMLCNPTTKRLFSLPQLTTAVQSYFGYDPINKQFSVLAICRHGPSLPLSYQILKLESGTLYWRNIKCPLDHHYPLQANICINGILYYIAHLGFDSPCKIACFDLNSEEFKFIDQPSWSQLEFLVNFKGKLGGIIKRWKSGRNLIEVSLWVLEDKEKQEWSKHVYLLRTLWRTKFPHIPMVGAIVGVTATCELVVALSNLTLPFYVYFFNIEKNIIREVEIKGFERFQFGTYLQGFVDYVENLKDFNWS